MQTVVVLRKKRQVTLSQQLCDALGVEEEDLLTIDVEKVIRKERTEEVEEHLANQQEPEKEN
ncbi:MAG: hypothetical protein KAU62_00290 [Candidatus Heimdallarchaeota archaeon]|nr:hypothetical protein [Candidatus Heimdallarchaeota archaeon]MCK4609569.1 hypothetical protein [Candidatus Heimdallarchaeota archaeon]